eukprot:SAG31_NODE_313_length_17858_cov_34.811307_18_plen_165_part_00
MGRLPNLMRIIENRWSTEQQEAAAGLAAAEDMQNRERARRRRHCTPKKPSTKEATAPSSPRRPTCPAGTLGSAGQWTIRGEGPILLSSLMTALPCRTVRASQATCSSQARRGSSRARWSCGRTSAAGAARALASVFALHTWSAKAADSAAGIPPVEVHPSSPFY